jgi:hypothetical protein
MRQRKPCGAICGARGLQRAAGFLARPLAALSISHCLLSIHAERPAS